MPQNLVDPIINSTWVYTPRIVNMFTWSHGGTSHCITLDDNLNGSFFTSSSTTCDLGGVSNALNTRIHHDGSYGTLPISRGGVMGSTYWGNTTTFDS